MSFSRIVIWGLVLLLGSCNNKNTSRDKITIAVAANMQFAMHDLVAEFNKQSDLEVEIILGSSGKLAMQIKEGAPYDMFISADMIYPAELYKLGFAMNKPKVYAYGKLVIWSMYDNIQPSINFLSDSAIEHIAIANPQTAPYGVATIEVLKHYGLLEKVQDKLVYGESISQTNHYIINQTVPVGFTSKAVVLSPEMVGKGRWVDVEDSIYTPIAQGVVLLKRENKAEEFYGFLFSNQAQDILKKFGYAVDR